jgi:hypothetical protein
VDEHPADKILGADWRPPHRVWLEEAWDKHPQRELLDERKRERGADGMPIWELVREVNEDGWVEYWQRQLGDPREQLASDQGEPIRVASWPEKREIDAQKDAQAIVDEHTEEF